MSPATLEIVLYCSSFEGVGDWVRPYAKNTIIYSTSQLPVRKMLQFKRVVYLPNIITESQAYLHHIVTRFHSLADVTIFCHSKSSSFFTVSITRMVELTSLTEVGEVMTFPGNDLVRFDAWELTGATLAETTNRNENGGFRSRRHPLVVSSESILLSGPALDIIKVEAHNITTPASVFWNAMAPSSKFSKLPYAIGYQPGCTFAVRKETIQQQSGDYWKRLYPRYFENGNSVTALEAGYYLSKFWWAFLSDDYILHDDDVVDKKIWAMKSGGRRELTKGNWIRRLQTNAMASNANGRNFHHFRTGSCSIRAENPFIRDMALYGLPSLRPANEKYQDTSFGISPSRIGLKKAHSMAMLTLGMSKLDVNGTSSEKPAGAHHRSVSENAAY